MEKVTNSRVDQEIDIITQQLNRFHSGRPSVMCIHEPLLEGGEDNVEPQEQGTI